MLLAFDIGNSHIVMGVFEGGALRHTWRIATDDVKTGDEYSIIVRSLLDQNGCSVEDIAGCAVANVVPALQEPIEQVCERVFGFRPLSIDATIDSGIDIRMDFPTEVGADRIVNAVAAHRLYGGPAVVIDFGTATTFDVVSEDSAYLGGAIAPGIVMAADALTSRAARLFRVELVVPDRAIGKNTVQAIQSGMMFGYVGLVEGLVKRIVQELGAGDNTKPPVVIATGGLARRVATHTDVVDVVDPDLTLQGLRLVYERNQQ